MPIFIILCILPSVVHPLEKIVNIHAQKHTHHISSIHDETTHTTKIIKEFKAPEGNADRFAREIIGYELALKAELNVPDTDILPYYQTYHGKKECSYGISSTYIPHVAHTVELHIATNAAEYLTNLETNPELIDVLAFDTVLSNIDRRTSNLLKSKKEDGGYAWYCIDHEWILTPFQLPTIFILNQYLLKYLTHIGHETAPYESLKKDNICEYHTQFTRNKIFERDHIAAIKLASLLAKPIKKFLPLIETDEIIEIAKKAFRTSVAFDPRSIRELGEILSAKRKSAALICSLYEHIRELQGL